MIFNFDLFAPGLTRTQHLGTWKPSDSDEKIVEKVWDISMWTTDSKWTEHEAKFFLYVDGCKAEWGQDAIKVSHMHFPKSRGCVLI